jgi:hypothetical protein
MTAPRRKPTAQQLANLALGNTPKYSAATLEQMRAMWEETEMTAAQIGARFGLSKSTVIGQASRRRWRERYTPAADYRTFAQRIDALHAEMDRVLAETRGVGRIAGSGSR